MCRDAECVENTADTGTRMDTRPDVLEDAADTSMGGIVAPVLRAPPQGASTGSIHGSVSVADPALAPTFVWDPTARAERYELQVSDECTTPGFSTCAFESPTFEMSSTETTVTSPVLAVSTTAPVGRRYYWRVRACAGSECSAYSPVRYLDVGRQPNDFNGDGYADILAGANADDGLRVNQGRAFVWEGSATGPGAVFHLAPPDMQGDGRFGIACAALGDIDADGYADAVIAAYRLDVNATEDGAVYIYRGSGGGSARSLRSASTHRSRKTRPRSGDG